jgi:hypothetical protein
VTGSRPREREHDLAPEHHALSRKFATEPSIFRSAFGSRLRVKARSCNRCKQLGLPCSLSGCAIVDYLKAKPHPTVQGVVTNPPFKLAVQFAEKALREVPYLALLLRTNFLGSKTRLPFFRRHPPARIWISSRRLPMMHRYGWQGPRAPSNTCFGWFVWDARSSQKRLVDWFDWQELASVDDDLFTVRAVA